MGEANRPTGYPDRPFEGIREDLLMDAQVIYDVVCHALEGTQYSPKDWKLLELAEATEVVRELEYETVTAFGMSILLPDALRILAETNAQPKGQGTAAAAANASAGAAATALKA